MAERPYVLLSVAMSVDGCIDDATDTRLILSNDADLDRVDEVRAGSDAILVGAGTIRRDNPALLVRSSARRSAPDRPRAARRARPGSRSPPAATSTRRRGSSPRARAPGWSTFPGAEQDRIQRSVGRSGRPPGVEVIGAGDPLGLRAVLADLAGRGVRRLMVEGGGTVLAQFLAEGLADELDLVVAPVFVGDPAAPRLLAQRLREADAPGRGAPDRRRGAAALSAWLARDRRAILPVMAVSWRSGRMVAD